MTLHVLHAPTITPVFLAIMLNEPLSEVCNAMVTLCYSTSPKDYIMEKYPHLMTNALDYVANHPENHA